VIRFDFKNLLAELRAAGVSLWLDDDTLNIWPVSRLTPDQVSALRVHKAEIVAAHCKRMIDLLPSDEVCRAWRRRYCNTEQQQ
jgi:hypothetical protein